MTLDEARKLLSSPKINAASPQQWADSGCGSGLFTKAMLNLLNDNSTIYAIDKQHVSFTNPSIHFIEKDFEKEELSLPLLDGIMMANSFHYVKDKLKLLERLKKLLLPKGIFLLIEYDTETANRWVPYPLSLLSAKKIFKQIGFDCIEKISEKQSVYNSSKMYSAIVSKS